MYPNSGHLCFGEKSQKTFKNFGEKVLTIESGCDNIIKRSGERAKRVADRPPKKRIAKRFFEADTKKLQKSLKKVLTKRTRCAKISKLSPRQQRTLKIEQHDSLQI